MLTLVIAAALPAPPPDPVVVDPFLLAMLAGVVVPLLTGLATKITATTSLKATISFAFAGLLAALNQVVTAAVWDWRQFVLIWGTTFTAALVSYKGAWKPWGKGTDPVSKATPDIGIGPARVPPGDVS